MAATLKLDTITHPSNASTANLTLDASGNATVGNTLVMGSSFKRNRIINGDMRVDQRNAGAATGTSINGYTVDRWAVYQSVTGKLNAQQSSSTLFTNSLGVTSQSAYSLLSSDYYIIYQAIEGFNVADFLWGTSNAKTITLSFQVYTSLTGTFGGAVRNSATNRSYPFTYVISSANTWTPISITIPGDTSGTWLTTNGAGLLLTFGLGVGSTYSGASGSWAAANYTSATGATSVVGTNGATFYITGVQLEVGSIATPYERQIYSDQLAQCQRYLPAFNSASTVFGIGPGYTGSTTSAVINCPYVVTPRVSPTGITVSNASHITFTSSAGSFVFSAASFGSASSTAIGFISGTISGATAGQGGAAYFNSTSGQLLFTGCEL